MSPMPARMPAWGRKTAGAFVMLFCAVPAAAPGLAQTLSKPVPAAQKPAPAAAPAVTVSIPVIATPAPPVAAPPVPAGVPVAAPSSLPAPSLPAPSLAAPSSLPAPIAAKPEPKSTPKPGPGANDAGRAAASLRTVKLSLVSLIDRSVIGLEKREIGHVIDVLVDAKGEPAALVIDVGGFMGMGNRRIAIAWERFALAGRKPRDALQLPLSDAQVKAAPAYDGSEQVTVVQGAIEPAPAKPAPAGAARPRAKPSPDSSRVDLGEGLAPATGQTQPDDPLNPD